MVDAFASGSSGKSSEGPAASDAPELGSPVQIGGSVDDTSPDAAGEGDVRRIRCTPEGNMIVEIYKDNNSLSPLNAMPGASEVKGAREVVNNTSTAASAAAPGAGKKLRIISVEISWNDATAVKAEVYFHATGAGNSASDEIKIITEAVMDLTDSPNFVQTWPDGGGPVGAADDDITVRVATAVAADCIFIIHYREE